MTDMERGNDNLEYDGTPEAEEAVNDRETADEEQTESQEGRNGFAREAENNREAIGEDSEEASEEEEDPEEADEEDSPDSDEEDRKKSLFRKKEKKKDKSAEQIADLNDKLRRQMAEFDNFRKRTEREKSQMYEIGAKSVVEKILPVVDSFERGLNAIPEEAKDDPYVQGMDKIYRQLMTELENLGVKAIDAVGQEFNPDFHNAVMQVENDELESGTVAQELQKGYMYRDSVVRHSMVSVVQ